MGRAIVELEPGLPSMITLRLSDELGRKLGSLAVSTGLPADLHAERAIADYLADVEDYGAAPREVEEMRAGRSVTVPLAETMERYGSVE